MEEKGGTRMVTYAFKSDYTPEIPDDESEKLSTTIKLSEVLAAGVRLEASAFSIEAHNAVTALTNSDLPLIPLYGKEGLCQGGYYPHRFKRVYVSPEKGVPFLSSSEIISLRPKTNNFVSKNYTLKLDRLLPEKWDVLISRSGTIGNIGLATETFIGNALSEHVIRLQANEPETAGYVAAFLRSRYGRPQLTQATYGSVIVQIETDYEGREKYLKSNVQQAIHSSLDIAKTILINRLGKAGETVFEIISSQIKEELEKQNIDTV